MQEFQSSIRPLAIPGAVFREFPTRTTRLAARGREGPRDPTLHTQPERKGSIYVCFALRLTLYSVHIQTWLHELTLPRP